MVDIISERETLEKLEAKAVDLQSQGKYLECLEVMQEVLTIQKQQYGEDSIEFQKSSEKICELCNLIAMIFLQKEKFDTSIEFLKKAEILSYGSMHFRSITLNNLACYYRRIGKLRTALSYLQQALQIEIKLDNPQSLSDTHLNLCAVFSSLNKHEDALQHALMAIMMLQDQFMDLKLNSKNEENIDKKLEDRCPVLAIAYHNLGVELEYLKRYDESIKIYQKAVNFAQTNLGEHPLIENLQNVLQSAQEQVSEIILILFFNKFVSMKNKEHKKKMAMTTNSFKSTQRMKQQVTVYKPKSSKGLSKVIVFQKKTINLSKTQQQFKFSPKNNLANSEDIDNQNFQVHVSENFNK